MTRAARLDVRPARAARARLEAYLETLPNGWISTIGIGTSPSTGQFRVEVGLVEASDQALALIPCEIDGVEVEVHETGWITPASSGLGQAAKQPGPVPPSQPGSPAQPASPSGIEIEVDTRLMPWLLDPVKAPEAETVALSLALTDLRDVSNEFVASIKPATDAAAQWRTRIAEKRQRLAAASRAGMGEVALLRRLTGEDYADLSGPFSKISKSLRRAVSSVTKPIEKIGKEIDQAVFKPVADAVFKPVGEVIGEAGRAIDSALFKPIKETAHAFEKAAIRPVTSSKIFEQTIKDPLKKVEKYTIRPTGEHVAKGIQFLDKYVPGWATVLDFVVPLPFISTIVGQLGKMVVSGNVVEKLVPTWASTPAGVTSNELVRAASELALPVTEPITTSVTSIVSHPLAQFHFTISKGTDTFIRTKGDLLAKLQATAIEALNGFALAVTLAGFVAAPGLAALQALNVVMTSLQAGVTVLTAWQAARVMKEQANDLRRAAAAEVARLAAEDAALEAEIRRMEAELARIRREREALLARQRGQTQPARTTASERSVASGVVSPAAIVFGAIGVGALAWAVAGGGGGRGRRRR